MNQPGSWQQLRPIKLRRAQRRRPQECDGARGPALLFVYVVMTKTEVLPVCGVPARTSGGEVCGYGAFRSRCVMACLFAGRVAITIRGNVRRAAQRCFETDCWRKRPETSLCKWSLLARLRQNRSDRVQAQGPHFIRPWVVTQSTSAVSVKPEPVAADAVCSGIAPSCAPSLALCSGQPLRQPFTRRLPCRWHRRAERSRR